MAAPKPIGGAEKCRAYALVEGVYDDARGAGQGGGDQVVAASGLRGEEVAFPGNVGVEVGAEIGWSFLQRGKGELVMMILVMMILVIFFSFFFFFEWGEGVRVGLYILSI